MERLKAYRNIVRNLQWNSVFEDIQIRKNLISRKRVVLLQDIMTEMNERTKDLEELGTKIFEYGSLIEQNDLLARHIFLVLQVYLREQQEQSRKKTGEYGQ